jgi:hypothetical protein
MTGSSNPSYCYFCKREFRAGEGRYRFFQKETEVECCPDCFDETGVFPQHTLEKPAGIGPIYMPEN